MSWRIAAMPHDGPLFEGAISVYAAAFAGPPYHDGDRGREVRQRLRQMHRQRVGFSAFIALNGRDHVVGMTYGHRASRGQWWYDMVATTLSPASRERWLSDAFELVELAVSPRWQSRGIGSALVAELVAGRTEATCVLSTRTDSRAQELYRRLGFGELVRMRFVAGGHEFIVMGMDLA